MASGGYALLLRERGTESVALVASSPGTDVSSIKQPPTSSVPAGETAAPPASGSAPVMATDHVEQAESPSVPTWTSVPKPARFKAVPEAGAGEFRVVTVPDGPVRTTGRILYYAVEVEEGLEVDAGEFAATVRATLTDPRGWQDELGVGFVPVAPEDVRSGARVDFRVSLASNGFTSRLCAPLATRASRVSCFNGYRSVINLYRWEFGSVTYGADLIGYRQYVINHEVGHALGKSHVSCPSPGQPGPIMLQQTLRLDGCQPWSWPRLP
ncbi:MAG: hypothetical protein CSA84_04445 [Actinomycetales bacterium]|nr:MAG: hypothetical protein CSA84_04445 [Actinomycetales bacterium]